MATVIHFRLQGHHLTACGVGATARSSRRRADVSCPECQFAADPPAEPRRLLDLAAPGGVAYCPTCGHRSTHWPDCPEAEGAEVLAPVSILR